MVRFSKDGCGGYTAEMADRTVLGTVQRMDSSWYWAAFYHYGPGYKDGFSTRKAAGEWLLGHHNANGSRYYIAGAWLADNT